MIDIDSPFREFSIKISRDIKCYWTSKCWIKSGQKLKVL